MEPATEQVSETGSGVPAHRYRHPLAVRITHWLNLLFLTLMLGSGLQIFNAHPALYWGSRSDPGKAWLSLGTAAGPGGGQRGVTRLFGHRFDTTGVLDLSNGEARGFPRWATIPGPRWLAMGRRWHFFFAWLLLINALVYIGYSAGSRHLRRDLLPRAGELRRLGASVRTHLHWRRLRAEARSGYNVLQKLTYLGVIFVLGPLIVLTGLSMSPWLDSVFPWLPALFGGRQSARSIHFIVAWSFVLFVVVHLAMLMVVGPLNHLRAMITGRLRLPEEAP